MDLSAALLCLISLLPSHGCAYAFISAEFGYGQANNMLNQEMWPKSAGTKSRLKRRDISSTNCGTTVGAVKHQFALKGDGNINMQLLWVGSNLQTQLLVTTFDVHFIFLHLRKKSKLYKSTNDGLSFEQIEGQVKDADIRTSFGIVKSDVNPSKLILVGFSGSFPKRMSTLFLSEDGAKSWKTAKLPFQVREDQAIIPHSKNDNWLLALEEGGSSAAWLSVDFGSAWVKLKDNAFSVKWGADSGNILDNRIIFVTVKNLYSGKLMGPDSSLWRSKDLGNTFEKLHGHIYSIGIQGPFLFITVDLDSHSRARVMHVSKNNGDNFHKVQVPEVTPERFYAILDMSEGQIFLHVDEPEDTGKGNLYISDADGIFFSMSLENHFYTNDAVTDFYKVESMRGVFLTHQLQEDKTLRSVITFDRGATWNELFLTDAQCRWSNVRADRRCSLHYHHTYSMQKGHNVQGPLSTSTALGIILLHGVTGDALHKNNTSVYLSRNGGYNWTKVLDGPHFYAIGDHGNLIAAVPSDPDKDEFNNVVKYSLDQGRCWKTLKFSDDPMIVRGLVTEPHSKKRTFSIWGVIRNDDAKAWQVITISFENILNRKCVKDDYEYWFPHTVGNKDGCYLGVKEKYPRVKQNTFCFSGQEYKPDIIKEHCKCRFEDLECEYGYLKDSSGKCKRDEKIRLEICNNGYMQKFNEGNGYRRIPGDQCKGGAEQLVKKLIDYIDTKTPCEPPGKNPYWLSDHIDLKEKQKGGGTSKGLLAFGLTMIFLILFISLLYVSKRIYQYRSRRHSAYRYSQLLDDEKSVEADNRRDPIQSDFNQYRDESDTESDAEILKL